MSHMWTRGPIQWGRLWCHHALEHRVQWKWDVKKFSSWMFYSCVFVFFHSPLLEDLGPDCNNIWSAGIKLLARCQKPRPTSLPCYCIILRLWWIPGNYLLPRQMARFVITSSCDNSLASRWNINREIFVTISDVIHFFSRPLRESAQEF